ncbi:MAG: transcriptional regulator, TetR family [Deltaproteobacteria bacterium]|jgi:AcrR family transcriptional regulator|nr:transcriptional regulator, TetR family [Deltaproteobacteria bacterium]
MNKAVLQKTDSLNDTRTRILHVAAEVFADFGFERATVRVICDRASVNVASINYHFRDKENLYVEVLKYCKALAFEKYPSDLDTKKSDSPEIRLKAFIKSFVFRILDEGVSSLFGRLVSREYIEPTGALDMLIEEAIRPTFSLLSEVVGELLGRRAPAMTVRMCCASVVSQCLFFLYARHALAKLFPGQQFGTADMENIADHITNFSLSAIQDFQKSMKGEKR